jgi:hypothetical protein
MRSSLRRLATLDEVEEDEVEGDEAFVMPCKLHARARLVEVRHPRHLGLLVACGAGGRRTSP